MTKRKCQVPDFTTITGTDTIEYTTMEMSFNANRINDLTNQLYVATIEKSDEIALERECYLKRLKNNIDEFESETRRIP